MIKHTVGMLKHSSKRKCDAGLVVQTQVSGFYSQKIIDFPKTHGF